MASCLLFVAWLPLSRLSVCYSPSLTSLLPASLSPVLSLACPAWFANSIPWTIKICPCSC
ncbi:hypothetical protein L226DRAFT_535112 [Lentinus tigrinus ALCF2SS1-7]|uniref:Uncharacterized protein n=1 Tax=Lentinus tigrinus ALCF2SS1-6 TaxID=1328759 RepID=A0A5C2RWG9_9APHY|nr:hypothetical protein L227DRAFT_580117 [Lentinus tigrinus ALCF2SS1-6]RPD59428.1 hypothetical protein L227DRAFT_576254 [Lentinus tigrinus ALCF2SS1-6]RPD74144.1 hypothetical protein L226DRAFT_535614 [Lentinus tigrinus ALCF2SS1-7]RPD74902.1 hypothetical protein L226DRAFT_535112 [Lentinus tigrinus ALCF2SS1-7]